MYNYSTIKLNNILHHYKIYIFISVQKLSYELKFRKIFFINNNFIYYFNIILKIILFILKFVIKFLKK